MLYRITNRRVPCRRALICISAMMLVVLGPGIDRHGSAALEQGEPASADTNQLPDASAAAASPATVPAYRQANKVAVLTIEGVVDRVTLRSLERRVERAQRDGADAIVLDINTPGGELMSTLDICHLLKTDAPPNTVAWINPNAYSAGTIIALAAREIVVQENASFGDAAPIAAPLGMLIQMPAAERAKIESPILEEVVNSARRNGYDEKLVQAFVSVGVELWLIEHNDTGDRIFVDREEYRRVFGEDPPRQLTAVTPSIEGDERERVRPLIERVLGRESGESEALEDAGVVTEWQQQLPSPRPHLTEADRGSYHLIKQVTAADRLLTVRPDEALFYGLAVQTIRNDEELAAYFGAQELARYDQLWSESLARFLMSAPVRGILIVIFLVALFIELSAPGLGVFGTTAMIALLLLLGAPALMGMAAWWGIVLVAAGLLLIGAELFVIPGMGLAGALGLLSLMVGLIGTFVTGDLGTSEGQNQLWAGIATTVTAVFAAGVIMWLISRQLHSFPILDRLILKTELGPIQKSPLAAAALDAAGDATSSLVAEGDVGVAHTSLRPAGRATFGKRIVDVQSMGGFIEQGTPVRVVSIGKYVIEVEEATE